MFHKKACSFLSNRINIIRNIQEMCSQTNLNLDTIYLPANFYYIHGLNSFPHNADFEDLWKRNHLKTVWEKEKMLVTSIFSFSQNVFYPFKLKFQFLSHIYCVICNCFQFGQDLNFFIW